jgi:hypothetical protein
MASPSWADTPVETSTPDRADIHFPIGTRVKIDGLVKLPHLNDTLGMVISKKYTEGPKIGRYDVELVHGQKPMAIFSKNLSLYEQPAAVKRKEDREMFEFLQDDCMDEEHEAFFDQFLLESGQISSEDASPEVERLRDQIGHMDVIVTDKDALIAHLTAENARLTAENIRLRLLNPNAPCFKPAGVN